MQNAAATVSLTSQQRAARARLASAGCLQESIWGSCSVFSKSTCSLHCSSFLGLPYRILIICLVKPKKGTTMETVGII